MKSDSPEGLLLVDKPAGITSHDVVDRVRRAYGERSVGHLGTLDPQPNNSPRPSRGKCAVGHC